jgi:hypothetical protein
MAMGYDEFASYIILYHSSVSKIRGEQGATRAHSTQKRVNSMIDPQCWTSTLFMISLSTVLAESPFV